MSLTFEEENFMSPQWAGLTSTANFNLLNGHWLGQNMDEFTSAQERGTRYEAVFDQYATFAAAAPLSSPSISSDEPQTPPVEKERSNAKQTPGRGPGRPKLDTDGNAQAAKDRRRAQVRQAQQAYRHRKEATLTTLRAESSDLRARIHRLEKALDGLFIVVERSTLVPEDRNIVQELCEDVDRYRLPLAASEDETSSEIYDLHGSESEGKIKRAKLRKRGELDRQPTSLASDNVVASRGTNTETATQSSQFLFEPLKAIRSLQSTHPILRPPFRPFEDLEDASLLLPFSIRFRNLALKQGYDVITSQETSYSDLCRAFRHSIFSKTREDILRHIMVHLDESTKITYQALSAIRTGNSFASRSGVTSFESSSLNQLPLLESGNIVHSSSGEELIEGGKDGKEEYIDPDGLQKYLSDRGISVEPGSDVVSLPLGNRKVQTATPTLFDEIRSSQPLKLSVKKLTAELLDRIVCLDFGPGIKPEEIDEAIRSTVIAAI